MKFGRHISPKLNALYEVDSHQGANPYDAQIIFIGRDPNWKAEIESMDYFHMIEEYLKDGVEFWKTHNVHHPFLLDGYAGSGRRYHKMISKIGMTNEMADKISFIELISFPTTGMAKSSPKVFDELLFSEENENHLIFLDHILKSEGKLFFIAWGLIRDFQKINKKTGLFGSFNEIDLNKMDIKKVNIWGNYIIHRHFSDTISNETLKNIGTEIENFLRSKNTIDSKLVMIESLI